MKKILFSLFITLNFCFLVAQDSQTLFELDGNPISTSEFEKVYTKNNINNQADYSEASLNEYLELFINFKLKVAEAEALQMDTIPAIKNELKTYQKQLLKNYANDKEVSEALLQEAFERSKFEIDASHILVLWPNSYPSASDSAKVLKEIQSIKKGLNPANFAQKAKLKSQDPSAKDNEGRLGYLTSFQTVYPFENALYVTKSGEISGPVATQFGYHLVLVHDKRPARGKIKTAHILIKSKSKDVEEKQTEAKNKIEKIHSELKAGEVTFETAVKQYSEDKKTKFQGGKLPELSSAEMITEFADAAFSLKVDGDISAPILTSIGWHIIQRVSKTEMGSFDEMKTPLANNIARDSRSNVAQVKNNEDSKKQFGFSTNPKALDNLIQDMSKSFDSGSFKIDESTYQSPLFTIGDHTYLQNDYIKYAKNTLKKATKLSELSSLLRSNFDKFQSSKIQQYREDHLAEINEDYKDLMKEYHDGILLFELTDKEVWSKAVMDTSGLKAFHAENKMNYMWSDRVAYTSYTFKDEQIANKGAKLIKKGLSPAKILGKLNKKESMVTMKTAKIETADFDLVDTSLEEGAVVIDKLEDGKLTYKVVNTLFKPEPKLLSETRGYVISDYQGYLEKEWITSLKQKFSIEVNKEVFNSLIR